MLRFTELPSRPAGQPAPAALPRTCRGLSPGLHQHSAQAPAWFPGPALREEAGSRPGKEVERGRKPDPTSSPPPLPGLRVRTWWWRQGEGGGSGLEETGSRAFGGAGGGERCSLPPLRGPGLGPGGPRGQGKGPGQSPHPGLSQARAGAGSGPLPRASRSAKPGPGPRAPTAPPARGAPTSFSGQRRGGPAPEAAVAAAGLAPSEGPGGGSEPGPAPPPAAGGQSPPGLGGGRCKLPRIWVRPPASPTPGPGLH